MIGAYGAAMRTGFNGFGTSENYTVADEPMQSMYTGEARPLWRADNVVSINR